MGQQTNQSRQRLENPDSCAAMPEEDALVLVQTVGRGAIFTLRRSDKSAPVKPSAMNWLAYRYVW